ncbi:MAG: ABC transporter permease [Chitinophagaceae bacterium]|nr:MAG: ABC transporter permease [Chitinophagaceae bacterium]
MKKELIRLRSFTSNWHMTRSCSLLTPPKKMWKMNCAKEELPLSLMCKKRTPVLHLLPCTCARLQPASGSLVRYKPSCATPFMNWITSCIPTGERWLRFLQRWCLGGARRYKMIDFFLPGMIGFSLIGSAVFGIAFLFYSLRETLVLKRMYATPIRRGYIILGESISKVLFQMMTVVVLIVFGYFMYGFYLANGVVTFINMLLLSFLALLVFLGFGFLISSISKNQNVIPVYANLFMFPQYFLSGTFFPKTALPAAVQPFIQFLPLTAFNDALRNVAFEGLSLWSCWPQIAVLAVWGVLVYAATAKFFKWD